MRPQATATVERVSNFDGYSQDLGVDQASVEHLMMLLTNLYSDPAMAVIREYSTNALDSHRAAGVDAPIKVQLPSYLSRNFVVEDFGVGMSSADLKNTYLLYGASTKRDTDSQTGMLGLGCKAALTFGTQFFIQARKDGLETSVVLSVRDSETSVSGVPHAEFLVMDAPTTEPNGVKITIPVSERDTFNTKALNFFKFWSADDVSIAGHEHPQLDGRRIGEDLLIQSAANSGIYGFRGTSYIVMGGVAYPVDFSKLPNGADYGPASRLFVKWVPIGSVNFTPSREELHYTDRTIKTVDAAARESLGRYIEHTQNEVDACATHAEALGLAESLRMESNNAHRYTYQGEEVPDGQRLSIGEGIRLYNSNDGSKAKLHGISQRVDERVVFVQHFDHTRMTPTRRAKLRQHLEGTLYTATPVVLLAGELPPGFDVRWTESPVYEWGPIGEIKLPRTKRGGETAYSEISITDRQRGQVILDDLAGTDVLYYSPTEIDRSRLPTVLRGLEGAKADWRLLEVPKGSWERIKREHDSEFVHVGDYLEKQYAEALSKAPFAARLRNSTDGAWFRTMQQCSKLQIDDPDLQAQARKIEPERVLQAFDNSVESLTYAIYAAGRSLPEDKSGNIENIIANYPLARYASGAELEEYINATYAWRN